MEKSRSTLRCIGKASNRLRYVNVTQKSTNLVD
jgi:hypothetical protein